MLAFSQLLEDSANALELASCYWPYITQQKRVSQNTLGWGGREGHAWGQSPISPSLYLCDLASVFTKALPLVPQSPHLQLGEKTLAISLSSERSGTPRPVECLPALNRVWSSPIRGIGKETWKGKAGAHNIHSFVSDNVLTSAVFLCVPCDALSQFSPEEGRGPRQLLSSKRSSLPGT